jgi:hypothetical protein
MRITRICILLAAAALLVPHPSRSVEIAATIEETGIHLVVPGVYNSFSIQRGDSPDGPFVSLASRWIGCTEACEWLDTVVVEGRTYWYRFDLLDAQGVPLSLGPAPVTVPGLARRDFQSTAVPSPFEEAVGIRFRMPAAFAAGADIDVRIEIFDSMGRRIRIVADEPMPRGERAVVWDGRDDRGQLVPRGTYFYRIGAAGRAEAGRLIKTR